MPGTGASIFPAWFHYESGGAPSSLLTGLVSYWLLDETSGTRSDSVGSNHLTDNNTVGYDTGMHNNAAKFVKANSESLSLAAPGLINTIIPAKSMTISMWVKFDVDEYLIALREGVTGSTTAGFTVYYGNGQPKMEFVPTDGTHELPARSATLTTGVWYHLLYVYDNVANTGLVYTNGVAGTLAEYAYTPSIEQGSFRLGAWSNGSTGITGLMDEVAIWSRVLESDEITELYAEGAGKFYPFT